MSQDSPKPSMDSRRNMLIGIVAGIVIVAALAYDTVLAEKES
jgi:hypothetical protein